MNDLFTKEITNFFKENVKSSIFEKYPIFLCRNDGVFIFFKGDGISENDRSSIGALMGGAWQAAEAMADFIPGKASGTFSFSFGTSIKGLHVLPVFINKQVYYLGSIFYDEINPGVVKSKLRILHLKLNHFIKEHIKN
ncbi:MAG: hypothetical protein OXB84_04790, partial [Halobacteriovoraceae bacterium]|nr:hypothetical protein [Halobacteriovoraceae bacterium]